MGNKKELMELLDGMSEEQLESLQRIIETGVGQRPRKKRRGRGKRKRRNDSAASPPKEKVEDFLDGVSLSAEEKSEIKAASKFDREKGLDKPKEGGIISHGPSFKKIEAKCMDCGKTSMISPALLPPEADRFKCNKCSCHR